jgi:hypothetical protein
MGALSAVAFAQPSEAPTPVSRPIAAHAIRISPAVVRNVVRRWVKSPPAKVAKKVGREVIENAGATYFESGGTECEFPLPARFCSQKRAVWGLGQALAY